MAAQTKVIDMTQGPPAKLLLQFSLPILVGYLFQQVYTLADRIIVGRFVGADAFSAIGSTSALSAMFMAVCMGASMGAGVVVSQHHGARDEEKTASAIANGAYLNFLVAAIMTILALVLTGPLLTLLNTPAELFDDAQTYLTIYMGGLLAVAAYYVPFSILQALGDSKTPLIFLIFCSFLNIGLDLLLVIGFKMGVVGAAAATVLAQIIAAVCCLAYAVRHVPQVQSALHRAKPDPEILRQIVRVSLPTGFQYSLMYLSAIVLQSVVNGFGTNAIGAFTATTQIESLVEQIFLALGAAMVTFTGQNMGAGRLDRIHAGVRGAVKLSTAVALASTAILWIWGEPIMGVFVSDPAMTETAAAGIRISSLFLLSLGVLRALRYTLSGAGDSWFAMMNGIVEIFSRIGFAFALTAIPTIGVWGIWWTTGLTWTVTALSALIRYKNDKWTTKGLTTVGLERNIYDQSKEGTINGD